MHFRNNWTLLLCRLIESANMVRLFVVSAPYVEDVLLSVSVVGKGTGRHLLPSARAPRWMISRREFQLSFSQTFADCELKLKPYH